MTAARPGPRPPAPLLRAALLAALVALAIFAAPRGARAEEPELDPEARDELRRIVETRGFTRGLPASPVPTPAGERVFFLRSGPTDRVQSLYVWDAATAQTRTFLTPDSLAGGGAISREEQARRERQRVTERGLSSFEVSNDGRVLLVPYSGDIYIADVSTGAVRRLTTTPEPEIDPHLSPDGRRVAFTRGGALVALDLALGAEAILAKSADPHVSYGAAEFIAQEEMDRARGFWWSPDSRRIAFTEVDTREVPLFRVPDFSDPTGEGHAEPYPKAGDPNAIVRLGVVSAEGGPVRWLSLGGDAEYLARVAWEPSSNAIWMQTQPRSQKRVDLRRVDLTTGATAVVLSESDSTWVNLNDDFRILGAGERFLWGSERSGHRHLEIVSATGQREKSLTSGPWDVTRVADVDEERGEVLFAATKDGVTERHLYRVPLKGGAVRRITEEPGWHAASVHPDGHGLFVESFETEVSPPRQRVRRWDGKLLGELPSAALVPAASEREPIPEFLHVETGGQVPLDIAVCEADGPSSMPRPLVVYVYGGPGAQQVKRAWPGERGLVDRWLARQGFVTARIDGRGVDGRGHASERIYAGRLGEYELADQVAGVMAILDRVSGVDPERVGIWGWSYGGYMSLMALFRAPEVFQAGVSIAPVVDWRDYDTHYTERYLGQPRDNAAGYDASSVLPYVPGLAGRLQLVHGTGDDNVHFRGSMTLVNTMVESGKQFDLMVYPGTHMMESIEERTHLYELIWRMFAREL